MNESKNDSKMVVFDKEAMPKPRQSSDLNSSKTAVSLGGNRWKYQGKTYKEKSLYSGVGSISRDFHTAPEESSASRRADRTGFQRQKNV